MRGVAANFDFLSLKTLRPGRGARAAAFVRVIAGEVSGRALRLGLEERQQIFVDLIFVGGAQAMRRALVNLQDRALDQLGLQRASVGERHNLVVVALDDWSVSENALMQK